MQIRRMTVDDLPAVAALEAETFSDPWSYGSFEYEVKNNAYSIPLILEKDGTMAGYAIIWRIYEEFHLANIAIQPQLQGQGLGAYFLSEVLKMKGETHYAILEVRKSNKRAIRLYKRFGFSVIMERVRYYRNGETALVMHKNFLEEKQESAKEKNLKNM
ncbi:MAG: ribosomal protein S18-alanine N-acetyltransferase [Calditrichia bacterium]